MNAKGLLERDLVVLIVFVAFGLFFTLLFCFYFYPEPLKWLISQAMLWQPLLAGTLAVAAACIVVQGPLAQARAIRQGAADAASREAAGKHANRRAFAAYVDALGGQLVELMKYRQGAADHADGHLNSIALDRIFDPLPFTQVLDMLRDLRTSQHEQLDIPWNEVTLISNELTRQYELAPA